MILPSSWVFDYKWNPLNEGWNPNPSGAPVQPSAPKIAATTDKSTDPVAENMLLYQRSNGGWPKHFKEKAVDYKRN